MDIRGCVQKYFYTAIGFQLEQYFVEEKEIYSIIFITRDTMEYVAGDILTRQGFEQGYIGFDDALIVERGSGRPPVPPVAEGVIIPSVINCHTHIGDAFIAEKNLRLPRDVEKLVAPPEGLKHRLLRSASDKEIQQGMYHAAGAMARCGTSCFCDFREGGPRGVRMLQKAITPVDIDVLCFSRPYDLTYDTQELTELLDISAGIGLSSISDWEYPTLEKIAAHVHQQKKLFALHCSEVIREDIDKVLKLKPDMLVHMVKATEEDLRKVKAAGIPIVVCPRSNEFFGLQPNLQLMKQVGNQIVLGTDNAMITSPDILEEMRFVYTKEYSFSLHELLVMVTFTARKALNLSLNILGLNSPADFVVLCKDTLKTMYVVG